MSPKIIIIALLLIGAFVLPAQNPSTIQVSVSDTIQVPATHISVMVSFKDTTKFDFSHPLQPKVDEEITEPDDTAAEEENQNPSPFPKFKTDFSADREAVIRILDERGVTWKSPAEQMGLFNGPFGQGGGMGLGGEKKNEGLVIDFLSKAQMDLVLPKIKENPFVATMDMGASVDKQLVDKTRLYDKLLKQSRKKAESIAALAGKRVGDVYQIGSAFDGLSMDKYMDSLTSSGGIFGGIFKMLGGMFSEKNPEYNVTISENMTVTYLLR